MNQSSTSQSQFLYLISHGWKTRIRHKIEIWFVEYNKKYYIISEHKKRAHWVQNIFHDSKVSFTVDDKTFEGYARVIDDEETELISNVVSLMKKKYRWGDGLVVELNPNKD